MCCFLDPCRFWHNIMYISTDMFMIKKGTWKYELFHFGFWIILYDPYGSHSKLYLGSTLGVKFSNCARMTWPSWQNSTWVMSFAIWQIQSREWLNLMTDSDEVGFQILLGFRVFKKARFRVDWYWCYDKLTMLGAAAYQLWKYQFSYNHWSQATLSSVSTWMGDCSSVAWVLLLTLKVG